MLNVSIETWENEGPDRKNWTIVIAWAKSSWELQQMIYFELLDWKIISLKQDPLSSLGSKDLGVFTLHESVFQWGSLFFRVRSRVKCELTGWRDSDKVLPLKYWLWLKMNDQLTQMNNAINFLLSYILALYYICWWCFIQ